MYLHINIIIDVPSHVHIQGMSFPRENINPFVLSPCQQRSPSLLHAGGVSWTPSYRRSSPEMPDAQPLFATERTRYRTENRSRGALLFFVLISHFKNTKEKKSIKINCFYLIVHSVYSVNFLTFQLKFSRI